MKLFPHALLAAAVLSISLPVSAGPIAYGLCQTGESLAATSSPFLAMLLQASNLEPSSQLSAPPPPLSLATPD
ncbi:uncharacterized protein FIBRA_07922 [Fibroporia radiculosa]|uniref:Uncharacterized protein n=1 Tax=Fibroporia radiculosa TaxID=599839 RepID=J4IC29_9APHY|nr:uncharacterized protein FIBRA_07922 [Fibroporia radiculosa]CCM05691.1 predicted protein [Fibroporia radiculosa]